MLPHLDSGWEVDQAIVTETERVVVIRFGVPSDSGCAILDEMLYKIAFDVSNFARIYAVDIDAMTEYNEFYQLYDPFCLMFHYQNRLIKIDCGRGNNSKINFLIEDR
jgi:DIM1 family U5 snRNP protein